MPGTSISAGINSGMGKGGKAEGQHFALVRRVEHILYRAVLVFHAYLRLMGVAVVGVHGVRVRVQLLNQLIRHHGPAEEQEQREGDMLEITVHVGVETKTKIYKMLLLN